MSSRTLPHNYFRGDVCLSNSVFCNLLIALFFLLAEFLNRRDSEPIPESPSRSKIYDHKRKVSVISYICISKLRIACRVHIFIRAVKPQCLRVSQLKTIAFPEAIM